MREALLHEYGRRLPLLRGLAKVLQVETEEALQRLHHVDRVYFRVKDPHSFVEKALDPRIKPSYARPLEEIEDQIAGRILVFFYHDIELVDQALKETFSTVERSDRRPPKDAEFGYESRHLICVIPPHVKPGGWGSASDMPTTFELQVRTLFMHAYAEPQHDLAYKRVGDLPGDVRRELAWVAASAWGADRAYERVWGWHEEQG